MDNKKLNVPIMADLHAEGKKPEVLFWVGCAGSFDQRAQKITVAFCKILNELNINYAILGKEESCTGDPARRAGNEFAFQMKAQENIMVLNTYEVSRIVTTCPHCFNILKNEYPKIGMYDAQVMHHSQYLQQLIDDGQLKVDGGAFQGKTITYHDSCYLGRANEVYNAPRNVLKELDTNLAEMAENKSRGLCCGAGGAQMFKEDEKGDRRINSARTDQVLDTKANIVAANCPFCITMLQDGLKEREKQDVMVLDLSELIVQSNKL
ncbi:(Fe-S)-binding protein [Aureispira anguillae]|uniref:(Fe-S)-binding protein n=1 Tax=Aureispira anguillae TaxID=2864201 RepID=A0A915YFJ3_9BACT|nr:(Fe-S)-binding protein [Aureispira anguillae]BDS12094.1 (Fe-S)-binding protein [Aureispira anguillae]